MFNYIQVRITRSVGPDSCAKLQDKSRPSCKTAETLTLQAKRDANTYLAERQHVGLSDHDVSLTTRQRERRPCSIQLHPRSEQTVPAPTFRVIKEGEVERTREMRTVHQRAGVTGTMMMTGTQTGRWSRTRKQHACTCNTPLPGDNASFTDCVGSAPTVVSLSLPVHPALQSRRVETP